MCGRILADWERKSFAATPNALCGWCDFLPICEQGREFVAQRGAPPADAAEIPF